MIKYICLSRHTENTSEILRRKYVGQYDIPVENLLTLKICLHCTYSRLIYYYDLTKRQTFCYRFWRWNYVKDLKPFSYCTLAYIYFTVSTV